jgi:hypothetical protein
MKAHSRGLLMQSVLPTSHPLPNLKFRPNAPHDLVLPGDRGFDLRKEVCGDRRLLAHSMMFLPAYESSSSKSEIQAECSYAQSKEAAENTAIFKEMVAR